MNSFRTGVLLLLPLAFPACSARRPPRVADGCFNTAAQLEKAWTSLQEARAAGCEPNSLGVERCDVLRREIERLAQTCAAHPPALMANAVLAYDARNLVQSQRLLDELLALPEPHPDAAALRARVAIEEGNLPFALRFLAQQVRLNGDHAGLREAYASALFLDRRYPEAGEQLNAAAKLGAPPHRVLFHRALISESQGRNEDAMKGYAAALEAKPGWPPAASRLRALQAK